MKRWNGAETESKRTVDFTPELLESLGASGKTQRTLASELKVSQQWLSKQINKSNTNRQAFNRGKLKTI